MSGIEIYRPIRLFSPPATWPQHGSTCAITGSYPYSRFFPRVRFPQWQPPKAPCNALKSAKCQNFGELLFESPQCSRRSYSDAAAVVGLSRREQIQGRTTARPKPLGPHRRADTLVETATYSLNLFLETLNLVVTAKGLLRDNSRCNGASLFPLLPVSRKKPTSAKIMNARPAAHSARKIRVATFAFCGAALR